MSSALALMSTRWMISLQARVDVEVEQGADPRQHHLARREAGHVVGLLGLQTGHGSREIQSAG
jgi:hypothetical protein